LEKVLKANMRLLVVSQYFWPENFRINELVTDWVQRGHEVTVLTGRPNYPDGRVFPAYQAHPGDFAVYNGAQVVRVPMCPRGQGGMRLLLNYASFVAGAVVWGPWKLRGRAFDAVFVYEPSPVTVGIPGVVMGALKKAPVAFWVLDLWPDTLKAVGVIRSERVLGWVGHLVRWIYRRCDLILAQSQSFIGHIARYAPKAVQIRYFPAWADDVFDAGQPVVPAPEVPTQNGVFTVLFAGNVGEAQDFPAILDAAAALRDRSDIRWVVVGDGRMSAWVAEQLTVRGLQERVQMVGRHPLERMPSFFAHADALLVSLKDEPIFAMTIPGKLQAYLGAGKPVLAMLNGEGAAMVASAKAGLVAPAGDAQALAARVLEMAAMPFDERLRMGYNGRQLCQTAFDRGVLMDQLNRWLEALIRRPHRSKGLL
jgi:colanic acid biosynthesis glycosyl transferase WcaI